MKKATLESLQKIYMLANLSGLRSLDPHGRDGFIWRTLDDIAKAAEDGILGRSVVTSDKK